MCRVLTLACLVAAVAAGVAPAADSRLGSITAAETSLLRAVNGARAAHGLAPLVIDPTLERAARAHSADMLRRHYFAHGAFAQRLSSFGARGPVLGENLAWGTGRMPGTRTVALWLASPPHRANLLRAGFRRVGVATPVGAFGGFGEATVVTADFAGS